MKSAAAHRGYTLTGRILHRFMRVVLYYDCMSTPASSSAKKPTKRWIFLLIAPIPLLILIAFLELAVHALFPHIGNGTVTSNISFATVILAVLNIISVLAGMASLLCLLLFPLWIILLVKASDYNKKLSTGHKTR